MQNKYLEKIAELHERVDEIQDKYSDRLFDLTESSYAAERDLSQIGALTESPTGVIASRLVGSWAGSKLRHSMKDDLDQAAIDHAKDLLQLKGKTFELSPHQARGVLETLQVPTEVNGWQMTKGLGTLGAGLAGAVGGGFAGSRHFGVPGAVLGALAGGYAAGTTTNNILGGILQDRIDNRDHDIDTNREQATHDAFDRALSRLPTSV